MLVGSFAYLTSLTTSCGRAGVMRNQAVRLGLATAAWLGITRYSLFYCSVLYSKH